MLFLSFSLFRESGSRIGVTMGKCTKKKFRVLRDIKNEFPFGFGFSRPILGALFFIFVKKSKFWNISVSKPQDHWILALFWIISKFQKIKLKIKKMKSWDDFVRCKPFILIPSKYMFSHNIFVHYLNVSTIKTADLIKIVDTR